MFLGDGFLVDTFNIDGNKELSGELGNYFVTIPSNHVNGQSMYCFLNLDTSRNTMLRLLRTSKQYCQDRAGSFLQQT